MSVENVTEQVLSLCRAAGFFVAGVADPAASARGRELSEWLAAGKHGSMSWLAETAGVRADPSLFLRGVRSVVMVADLYHTQTENRRDEETESGPRGARGKIARYARGDDYHVVMKRRLHGICDALRERFPAEQFRAFVDTAPVPERELAARAGLGWVGKNTLLIRPGVGSYFFLGGFAATLDLPPPPEQRPMVDHCGTCTRCIDACPTSAITPYSVDARRCISYLTIEHRGPIAEVLHAAMGEWMYGCDVCQEVCPHNEKAAKQQGHDAASTDSIPAWRVRDAYRARRDSFDLLDVLGWDEPRRRREFERSAMKRANLSMMRRNAVIVAGNTPALADSPALSAVVHAVADDPAEDPLVRTTAASVSRTLATPCPDSVPREQG